MPIQALVILLGYKLMLMSSPIILRETKFLRYVISGVFYDFGIDFKVSGDGKRHFIVAYVFFYASASVYIFFFFPAFFLYSSCNPLSYSFYILAFFHVFYYHFVIYYHISCVSLSMHSA